MESVRSRRANVLGRSRALVGVVALSSALAACGVKEATHVPGPPDVVVSVRDGIITAPDTVAPGWARIRVDEDGAGHIVVIFRLPTTASDADIASLLATLDTAATTPRPGVAMGGPEIGESGDVVVRFTPGRYILGCVRRGQDGHRHATTGEAKVLAIPSGPVDAARADPPTTTQVVRLAEFAYVTSERWAAGTHMLRVENVGHQDHQMRLIRLRPGSSMRDWLTAADPDELGTGVVGMARIGPGEVAYLPAELPAGTYVAYCLINDPSTKRQHIELGMLRSIKVE